MSGMSPFVPCPACGCHVFTGAPECPHCDAALPRSGRAARTVAAVVMGLSTTIAACDPGDVYGCPADDPCGVGGAGSTTATQSSSKSSTGSTTASGTSGSTTASGSGSSGSGN